jgi:uncharacterized protein YbaR (Trm112 family)
MQWVTVLKPGVSRAETLRELEAEVLRGEIPEASADAKRMRIMLMVDPEDIRRALIRLAEDLQSGNESANKYLTRLAENGIDGFELAAAWAMQEFARESGGLACPRCKSTFYPPEEMLKERYLVCPQCEEPSRLPS